MTDLRPSLLSGRHLPAYLQVSLSLQNFGLRPSHDFTVVSTGLTATSPLALHLRDGHHPAHSNDSEVWVIGTDSFTLPLESTSHRPGDLGLEALRHQFSESRRAASLVARLRRHTDELSSAIFCRLAVGCGAGVPSSFRVLHLGAMAGGRRCTAACVVSSREGTSKKSKGRNHFGIRASLLQAR